MKSAFSLAAVLILALSVSAQKKPDRPKVHADFFFGAIPPSRDAAKAMGQERARLVMVGLHEGWSEDKIAKELKWNRREVDGIQGDLTDLGLLGRRSTDSIPAIPVIRDRDIEELNITLQRHTRDFAVLLQSLLTDIEPMLAGLASSQPGAGPEISMDQRKYSTLVGGLLFGGMMDVFADDKTFMPAPPQRGKGQYYGWLVEGDSALAGKIQRDAWESETYQIVTVGAGLPDERPQLETIRSKGWILSEPDARRFRTFALVTARDKLLPFFKAERDELLKAHRRVQAGRYSSFAAFFAWYYNTMANGAVERLQSSGHLPVPAEPFAYALKTPVR